MCGLVGCYAYRGDLHDVVNRMSSALVHRGPDASGIWAENGIALAHRRLSIIDLSSAGAQPMSSACHRYIISYNGEIYNHLELRRQLDFSGASVDWNGHSDTETLLAGISHWGLDETLRKTSGMFALALWDRKEHQLCLARDRMGEKPLYWGWAGQEIVFGSELKALRHHPNFPTDICREALAQYMNFGYVPSPRSIHPGIYKLEPGCILTVTEAPPPTAPAQPIRPEMNFGSISISRYWSLNSEVDNGVRSSFQSENEAVSVLDTTLKVAVADQMMADVPVGAFLSGGVDSSLIVSLMQTQTSKEVNTFTVGFDIAAYNEAEHAAAVAKHLGTNHTEIIVTSKEALDIIPILPELYDEPFADSSQIPTYIICQIAREHVTVALSGDAGDELFGGYNRYLWGPKISRRMDRLPVKFRKFVGGAISAVPISTFDRLGSITKKMMPVSRVGDKAHKLAELLRNVENLDEMYNHLVSAWPALEIVRDIDRMPASVLEDALPDGLRGDPVSRMMLQDMRTYLPDDILCKVDRAAMGVSLETRIPFLDPNVVALSTRLPMSMKIRGNQGKWALRQILYQHVPKELIERPKAGFSIPVGEWLRGPLRAWAEDLLSEEALAVDGLLDPLPIRKVWLEHLSESRDWTHRLWIILMFQAWRSAQGSE